MYALKNQAMIKVNNLQTRHLLQLKITIIKKMAMIKGEVLNKLKKKRMMNKRSQEIKCHILGCTKVFNGITPWTTSLVTLQRE
jgi:hypothetical protein